MNNQALAESHLASVKHRIELIAHLVRRDFILRYKGSVLGILWYLLLPLIQLLILVFVFKKVIPLNIHAYPGFVFSGLLPWTWFSNSLAVSGTLFVANRDLVRRPNFPPYVLVTVSTLSNFILYLVSLPIAFILIFLYGQQVTATVFLLPIVLLIEGILIIGLGLMIATWNAFYRDVQQIVGVVLPLLFYLTPVFYNPQSANKRFLFLYELNPISVLIQSHRATIFYGTFPQWKNLLFALGFSILILAIGWRNYSRKLSDVIDIL